MLDRQYFVVVFIVAVLFSDGWQDAAASSTTRTHDVDDVVSTMPFCMPSKIAGASDLAGGLCAPPSRRYGIFERNSQHSGHVDPIWTSASRSEPVLELPKAFFWGNIHGVNYLTVSKNQHTPSYCSSCWAFGTTSAISDRIKIMRRNQFPEINLAPQVLISCKGGGTCRGGRAEGVYRYLAEIGLPDETCQKYQARDMSCTPSTQCQRCDYHYGIGKAQCSAVESFSQFKIADYGTTDDGTPRLFQTFRAGRSEKIMTEIYKRGPVSCTMFATQKFQDYTGGIFSEHGTHWHSNHIVSLVGWGEDSSGIPYWIGRNSWGTYWGENGFFRIVRGDGRNNLDIENGCSWATPSLPDTWNADDALPEDVPYGEYLLNFHDPSKRNREQILNTANKHAKKPLGTKREASTTKDIVEYDIRDINGVNFASINRNQNTPLYCESSWAHAAVSALNDRFLLLTNAAHPQISLSVQVLLNCAVRNGCNGGNASDAYRYIFREGIPDESCAPYEALPKECTQEHICKSCLPFGCFPLKRGEYTSYHISAHGRISGDDAVMKEVSAHGPLACRICDSSSFLKHNASSGIFADPKACVTGKDSKKYVVLSGWGQTGDGERYWIARNSWGNFWGERGWFRVRMGAGDLGITQECHWAIPKKPVYRWRFAPYPVSPFARIKKQLRSRGKQ